MKGCWLVWVQIRLWQALCILSPAVLPEDRGATLEQLHTILEVCTTSCWLMRMD